MSNQKKIERYEQALNAIASLCYGEDNEIALMATIVCELHQLPGFDWTGFYRVTAPQTLKIGPYQGGHGCLTIPFSRGVCGMAATTQQTQIVSDVNTLPYHIACSSSTQSEIVVPVIDKKGNVRAVLDVDSDTIDHFDTIDKEYLEKVVALLKPIFD